MHTLSFIILGCLTRGFKRANSGLFPEKLASIWPSGRFLFPLCATALVSSTADSGVLVRPAPLCDWFSDVIEYRDGAELIDNKLHLYQDQSVKFSNLCDYEVREIYPNHDPLKSQIFSPVYGELLLRGDSLEGDPNGLLVIGFFHENLPYPIKRTHIQLSENFDIRMKVEDTQSSLVLRYERSSNEPLSGSASYPYVLQYSIIKSKQDEWENTDVKFEDPASFHRHSGSIIDSKVYSDYTNSQGIKLRLLSSMGKTHLVGAFSRFEHIILYDDTLQKSIQVDDWIRQSSVHDIPYQIYTFDPSTGREEWKSYPKMRADVAKQHIKFEELEIQLLDVSAKPSMDGHDLMLKITLQTDPKLSDPVIDELVNQIEFYHTYSYQKSIAETHHKLPGEKIVLDVKFHLADHSLSGFQRITMRYNSLPDNPITKHLEPIAIDFMKRINSNTYESPIHPRYLSLKKEVTRVLVSEDGMFCPNCGEGIYWTPRCKKKKCGWMEGKPMPLGFVVQNNSWYEGVKQLNSGNFEFKLDSLSPGSYKLVFKKNTFSFSL